MVVLSTAGVECRGLSIVCLSAVRLSALGWRTFAKRRPCLVSTRHLALAFRVPRYTPTSCFETLPFHEGLTPTDTAHKRIEPLLHGAISLAELLPAVRAHAEVVDIAATRRVDLRDAWLNPPEWTGRVPEVVPLGMFASPYQDRMVAKPGHAFELAKRTLTNLYNARPTWLASAHAALDAAVTGAYSWADYSPTMPDGEILRRLLALNLARAARG